MKKREDNSFWNALIKLQRAIIVITGIATTLIVFFACTLRAVNINFAGFEEILVLVVFWLYMIGCSHGSYEKSQITADILAVMMPAGRVKSVLELIRIILTLALGLIFMCWGWQLLIWSLEMGTRTPVWRIPMVLGQSSLFVGLLLSSFYNLIYMIDGIKLFVRQWKTGVFAPESNGKEEAAL